MATHLLNILPPTTLKNDTPFHKLFQKQTSYSHLRVLGCLCFLYIVTRHKISLKSTPCIFLGYPTYHKEYRFLNLRTKQIILSRHVFFDEYVFKFGSMTPESPPLFSFLDHVATPPISKYSPALHDSPSSVDIGSPHEIVSMSTFHPIDAPFPSTTSLLAFAPTSVTPPQSPIWAILNTFSSPSPSTT